MTSSAARVNAFIVDRFRSLPYKELFSIDTVEPVSMSASGMSTPAIVADAKICAARLPAGETAYEVEKLDCAFT